MEKRIYLTKERIHELEDELDHLKTKERARISDLIAEARSHGDLKENGDYDAAKEAQGHLESRISKIQNMLSVSQTIEASQIPDDGKVYILSKVLLLNKKTKKQVEYMMVAAEEADIEQNKLAVSSPIGRALMGKAEGDVVSVRVPAGNLEFEVVKVSR